MNRTGFIFDLDGVIVDTAKYHYKAWKVLADQLGVPFSKERNEQFKGVSRKRCLELLLDWGNIQATPEQFEEWMVEKNRDYLTYIDKMDESEILPDVPRILQYLKLHHMPMAVGSASKNAVPILEKVKLLPYFDVVVDGTQVTKAKPDPEVFLLAANRLGIAPANCVVFEDALAGVEAANAAGMTSIGIGEGEILSNAHYVFRDFTDIGLDFIKDLIDKGER